MPKLWLFYKAMGTFSRRNFLGILTNATSQNRTKVNSSLDEYTSPLTAVQVRHLLRRTTFGINLDFVQNYTGKTANEAVNALFNNADAKLNPQQPFFVNDVLHNPDLLSGQAKTDAAGLYSLHTRGYNQELGKWWVDIMQKDTQSILEKMTLFWHGHFANQYIICSGMPADNMYLQNMIFRQNYAGNFQTILEKITLDGAMLKYLNGNENISESPNENYARELMELFTIGVGNYTEQDVKEAAKILTGWTMSPFIEDGNPFKATLIPNRFDANSKIFMGEVFNVNYEITKDNVFNYSVKKLLSTILSKRSNEAATFISQKLYKYFVYANPAKTDSAVITSLSQLLVKNNFEFKPMLMTLFKSQHFFDDLNVGVQIKSPVDTMISFTRNFNFDQMTIRGFMTDLGLELFNPPNVAGWKGYRTWIETKTLPLSIHILQQILVANTDDSIGKWAMNLPNSSSATQLTDQISSMFLALPLSTERLTNYTNTLLGNAPAYEWGSIINNNQVVGSKVRTLIGELIKAPDFYLF